MVTPTKIRPDIIYKMMDLAPWIEAYCLDAEGKPIKLMPWQKALLKKLQVEADEKIALRKLYGRTR